MDELDCVVYVDGGDDLESLVGLVQETLGGVAEGTTVIVGQAEVDARRNDDFDAKARLDFPDGFLYFRHRLEVYVDKPSAGEVREDMVTRLLRRLWEAGLPAVAACDYEAALPEDGGYGSRIVPWPGGDDLRTSSLPGPG